MNYLIFGLPGSGKSTLLNSLKSKKLKQNYEFIDLDIHLLGKYGHGKIGDWIRSIGFDEFRRLERLELSKLLENDHQIIALGGGTVSKENLDLFYNDNLQMIYVEATPEECLDRMKVDDNRPLVDLGKEQVIKILNERIEFFYKTLNTLPIVKLDQLIM